MVRAILQRTKQPLFTRRIEGVATVQEPVEQSVVNTENSIHLGMGVN